MSLKSKQFVVNCFKCFFLSKYVILGKDTFLNKFDLKKKKSGTVKLNSK